MRTVLGHDGDDITALTTRDAKDSPTLMSWLFSSLALEKSGSTSAKAGSAPLAASVKSWSIFTTLSALAWSTGRDRPGGAADEPVHGPVVPLGVGGVPGLARPPGQLAGVGHVEGPQRVAGLFRVGVGGCAVGSPSEAVAPTKGPQVVVVGVVFHHE